MTSTIFYKGITKRQPSEIGHFIVFKLDRVEHII